jgi:hypothetical protein
MGTANSRLPPSVRASPAPKLQPSSASSPSPAVPATPRTRPSSWLRGYQMTDANGSVTFYTS